MDTRCQTSIICQQLILLFLFVFLVASGCQTPFANSFLTTVSSEAVQKQTDTRSNPSATHNRLETIPLEFTFLRYAEEDLELGDELWQVIDEQCLPANLRHRLNGNGIRAGVVRGNLPKY